MAYPDTNLRGDAPDDDFGGEPAAEFGGLAWAWANAVLTFLGRAYLTYVRVPWTTVVAVSQGAGLAGQVACVVPGAPLSGRAYGVWPFNNATAGQMVLGVYLEPCSAGAKARVATGGIVPAELTGLAPQSAAADAGVDPATGKLRVAVSGDVVVGRIDRQGNVMLTGYGAAL